MVWVSPLPRAASDFGAGPFVARTHAAHASMLLRRSAPGDLAHADELRSRARATYRRQGMHHAAEHAEALARTGTHAWARTHRGHASQGRGHPATMADRSRRAQARRRAVGAASSVRSHFRACVRASVCDRIG
jgi:hypothetical protein